MVCNKDGVVVVELRGLEAVVPPVPGTPPSDEDWEDDTIHRWLFKAVTSSSSSAVVVESKVALEVEMEKDRLLLVRLRKSINDDRSDDGGYSLWIEQVTLDAKDQVLPPPPPPPTPPLLDPSPPRSGTTTSNSSNR